MDFWSLEGVEKRAKNILDMGPPQPGLVINGGVQTPLPSISQPAAAAPAKPGASFWDAVPRAGSAPSFSEVFQAPAPNTRPVGVNSLARGAAPGANSSLGGPVPQGRSMYNADRMAEQMVRQRDPRGAQFLFGTAMQDRNMAAQNDFWERGAAERGKEREMERFFQRENYAQQRDDRREERREERQEQQDFRTDFWNREVGQREKEATTQWDRMNQEIQRKERAEQARRGDPSQVTTKPVPGTDYIVPYVGNQPQGTLPVKKAPAPLPPGLIPSGYSRDGVQYSAPKEQKMEKPTFQYEKDAAGRIIGAVQPVQAEDGSWVMRRVKVLDENQNGIPDDQEVITGPSTSAPATGDWFDAARTKQKK